MVQMAFPTVHVLVILMSYTFAVVRCE